MAYLHSQYPYIFGICLNFALCLTQEIRKCAQIIAMYFILTDFLQRRPIKPRYHTSVLGKLFHKDIPSG